MDELADRAMERMTSEIPLYQGLDEHGRAEVRDIVRANVERCMAAVRERRAPHPEEIAPFATSARLRARQGWPLGELLQAYRLGITVWWEVVRDDHAPSRGEDVDAALDLASGMLRYLDAVQSELTRAFLDELEDAAAGDDRAHGRVLAAVVTHGLGSREAAAEAARAGVRMDPGCAAVLWRAADGEHPDRRLARAVRHAAAGAAAVVAPRRAELQCLWPADAPPLAEAARRVGAEVTAVVALSAPVHDGNARAAFAELDRLSVVARGLAPGAYRLEDLLLEAVVAQVGGRVERTLADLLAPLEEDERLLATLRAFLANGASLTDTAEQLFVHRNTVSYRLDRVRRLTGRDPARLHDQFVLWAALVTRDRLA